MTTISRWVLSLRKLTARWRVMLCSKLWRFTSMIYIRRSLQITRFNDFLSFAHLVSSFEADLGGLGTSLHLLDKDAESSLIATHQLVGKRN